MAEPQPPSENTDPTLVEGPVQGNAALGQAVTALLNAARRDVRLFAPRVEPAVFHAGAVTAAVARFAARHARNRLRILTEDAPQVIRENSRLIDLARRLADAIELREVEDNDRGARDAFLVVDHSLFLALEDVGRSDGVVTARAPRDAAQLIQRFDETWDRATPLALRTLGL